MKDYFEQLQDWLGITWYLITEPWRRLYEYWLDHFAPKWYVYFIFSYKLKHMKEVSKRQNLIDWTKIAYKNNKLSIKQADEIIEIIKTIPEKKVKVYSPDPDKLFWDKEI